MKIQKRILAFLTAALLLVPLTGCLVPKETSAADPASSVQQPDTSATDAPVLTDDFDRDAIAIELGDIQITAEELESTFDQYVSYFTYGYGADEESLNQFLRMTEEWLIDYYMPEWKAKELGVTLTDEQEAECAATAQATVDEERDMLLCYYGDPEGIAETASDLTEDQLAAARETIGEELSAMFGEGYSFDDYLAMRYRDALSNERISALSALLEEQFYAGVSITEEQIDEWYETTLAEQQKTFTEDPAAYLEYRNGTTLTDTSLCLYVPERAAKLQVIYVPLDESSADRIAELEAGLKELEAEYGALKLNNEDEARQAAIETEYADLLEEHAMLEAQQVRSSQHTIDSASADLLGGMSFEDVMDAYNEHADGESGRYELTVFLDGGETNHPELAEAANKLEAGAFSDSFQVGDDYYIIRLVEVIPQGSVDRASIADELTETVTDTLRADAWQAQQDAWLEEAKNAAVYHRETYDMLINMYL